MPGPAANSRARRSSLVGDDARERVLTKRFSASGAKGASKSRSMSTDAPGARAPDQPRRRPTLPQPRGEKSEGPETDERSRSASPPKFSDSKPLSRPSSRCTASPDMNPTPVYTNTADTPLSRASPSPEPPVKQSRPVPSRAASGRNMQSATATKPEPRRRGSHGGGSPAPLEPLHRTRRGSTDSTPLVAQKRGAWSSDRGTPITDPSAKAWCPASPDSVKRRTKAANVQVGDAAADSNANVDSNSDSPSDRKLAEKRRQRPQAGKGDTPASSPEAKQSAKLSDSRRAEDQSLGIDLLRRKSSLKLDREPAKPRDPKSLDLNRGDLQAAVQVTKVLFNSLERGDGWQRLRQKVDNYNAHEKRRCALDLPDAALFQSAAHPLIGFSTLAQYADWKSDFITFVLDKKYDLTIRSINTSFGSEAMEKERMVEVTMMATCSGEHIGKGGGLAMPPVPPTGKKMMSDFGYTFSYSLVENTTTTTCRLTSVYLVWDIMSAYMGFRWPFPPVYTDPSISGDASPSSQAHQGVLSGSFLSSPGSTDFDPSFVYPGVAGPASETCPSPSQNRRASLQFSQSFKSYQSYDLEGSPSDFPTFAHSFKSARAGPPSRRQSRAYNASLASLPRIETLPIDTVLMRNPTPLQQVIRVPSSSSLAYDFAPTTIPKAFQQKVKTNPIDTLVRIKAASSPLVASTTAVELYTKISRLARALLHFGFEPMSVCLTIGSNSIHWLVTYFAAIFCGGRSAALEAHRAVSAAVLGNVFQASKPEIVFFDDVSIVERGGSLDSYLSSSDTRPRALVHTRRNRRESLPERVYNVPVFSIDAFLAAYGEDIAWFDAMQAREAAIKVDDPCAVLFQIDDDTGDVQTAVHSHDNLLWASGTLRSRLSKPNPASSTPHVELSLLSFASTEGLLALFSVFTDCGSSELHVACTHPTLSRRGSNLVGKPGAQFYESCLSSANAVVVWTNPSQLAAFKRERFAQWRAAAEDKLSPPAPINTVRAVLCVSSSGNMAFLPKSTSDFVRAGFAFGCKGDSAREVEVLFYTGTVNTLCVGLYSSSRDSGSQCPPLVLLPAVQAGVVPFNLNDGGKMVDSADSSGYFHLQTATSNSETRKVGASTGPANDSFATKPDGYDGSNGAGCDSPANGTRHAASVEHNGDGGSELESSLKFASTFKSSVNAAQSANGGNKEGADDYGDGVKLNSSINNSEKFAGSINSLPCAAIADDGDQSLRGFPPPEDGELQVRHAALTLGSIDQPVDASYQWALTGLHCTRCADDSLVVAGSVSRLISLSGQSTRISPEKVEFSLADCLSGVDDCCVFGNGRDYLVALLFPQVDPTTGKLVLDAARVDPNAATLHEALTSAVWAEHIDNCLAAYNKSNPAYPVRKGAVVHSACSTRTLEYILSEHAQMIERLYDE
ncbi:hypothetical protein DIPPA_04152 [Diplonema papillatum]|nr:hypothetical protein DIPPA_04152 [Diplonema papillatum]